MSYYQPLSYWEQDACFSKVDVAIIGGGIVGMNAALRLKETNSALKVIILERSSIGTAASSRNAGFACYGSPSEIIADLQKMDATDVHALINRRVAGLALLKKTVGVKALKYLQKGGHEVFIRQEELLAHLDQLESINKLVCSIDPALKFYHSKESRGLKSIAGVISNDWEGQIHPGYMTLALRQKCQSAGIQVLTNFEVKEIKEDTGFEIEGASTSIKTSKVIISNNAFAKDLLPVHTSAGRNQVLLTSSIREMSINGCYHYDKGYVYFRNVDNRILIGGGRNQDQIVESTDTFGLTENIKAYLIDILDKHILGGSPYKIEYEWSGILGFNETKQPIVKETSPGKFVAVGLGGMGVAIGSLVGQEVADLLLQS